MLRGFLIRLTALDGQLEDITCELGLNSRYPSPPEYSTHLSCLWLRLISTTMVLVMQSGLRCELNTADIPGEATFGVIIETKDDMEPSTNEVADGVSDLSSFSRPLPVVLCPLSFSPFASSFPLPTVAPRRLTLSPFHHGSQLSPAILYTHLRSSLVEIPDRHITSLSCTSRRLKRVLLT